MCQKQNFWVNSAQKRKSRDFGDSLGAAGGLGGLAEPLLAELRRMQAEPTAAGPASQPSELAA